MRSVVRTIITAVLAATAFVPALGSTARADTVNVGICVSWPGYAMLELAQAKGLIPDHDLHFTVFEDPIGGHAALAAGQIDVYACTADYTPLIAARGLDVVEVALLNPSYGVDHIILAPGVEPSDLPGRKVAAPQAFIGHLLMGLYLDSIGIAPDQVTWVNLNADEAVGPMLSGDLAAAYMYEPWIEKVLAADPGARSVDETTDPKLLKTGIFMDALFMNRSFVEAHRAAAVAVLKARWDGLGYWNAHTDEANRQIADFLKWPLEDVEAVVGTNGKDLPGGVYMMDFDQSARICGSLPGEGPFGIPNGGIVEAARLTNGWWVRLGLMKDAVDVGPAIDCSLMDDLAASGYRQELSAH